MDRVYATPWDTRDWCEASDAERSEYLVLANELREWLTRERSTMSDKPDRVRLTDPLDQQLYEVVQKVMDDIRAERPVDYSDGSEDACKVRRALFDAGVASVVLARSTATSGPDAAEARGIARAVRALRAAALHRDADFDALSRAAALIESVLTESPPMSSMVLPASDELRGEIRGLEWALERYEQWEHPNVIKARIAELKKGTP